VKFPDKIEYCIAGVGSLSLPRMLWPHIITLDLSVGDIESDEQRGLFILVESKCVYTKLFYFWQHLSPLINGIALWCGAKLPVYYVADKSEYPTMLDVLKKQIIKMDILHGYATIKRVVNKSAKTLATAAKRSG